VNPLLQYDDQALLSLVKDGDETAFKMIFERYWDKLYAIAYNRLQSKQAAEDVVQEVLTGLWERRTVWKIQSLNSYLATAVRYSVFHELKKALTRQSLPDDLPVPGVLTVDDELRFKVLQERLQREVNTLPEKCRLVFQYSRELGMSTREIAEELEISPKTVEAHLTKALRQLRAHLGQFLSSFFTIFP
jgi:RNA polymerase sigma-70 factor (ECF subfamily)